MQTKRTNDILHFWEKMELVTPKDKEPGSDKILMDSESLPWNNQEKVNDKTVFSIMLGIVSVKDITEELNVILGENQETDRITGISCVASFKLNKEGKYMSDTFHINPFTYMMTQMIHANGNTSKWGELSKNFEEFNLKWIEIMNPFAENGIQINKQFLVDLLNTLEKQLGRNCDDKKKFGIL